MSRRKRGIAGKTVISTTERVEQEDVAMGNLVIVKGTSREMMTAVELKRALFQKVWCPMNSSSSDDLSSIKTWQCDVSWRDEHH